MKLFQVFNYSLLNILKDFFSLECFIFIQVATLFKNFFRKSFAKVF